MLVEGVVVIYVIDPQYVSVTKVVDVDCRCCGCGVRNRGSSALFFLFFYLLLYALFLLNLFPELR